MPTDKEKAQAERLATNAEAQRRQDEFGLAVARAQLAGGEEEGADLAEETRRLHAEEIAKEQSLQTDNDSSTPDDSVVSEAVKEGEGRDRYVETGSVSAEEEAARSSAAPEDSAYAPDGDPGIDTDALSDDTAAEVESAEDTKEDTEPEDDSE